MSQLSAGHMAQLIDSAEYSRRCGRRGTAVPQHRTLFQDAPQGYRLRHFEGASLPWEQPGI